MILVLSLLLPFAKPRNRHSHSLIQLIINTRISLVRHDLAELILKILKQRRYKDRCRPRPRYPLPHPRQLLLLLPTPLMTLKATFSRMSLPRQRNPYHLALASTVVEELKAILISRLQQDYQGSKVSLNQVWLSGPYSAVAVDLNLRMIPGVLVAACEHHCIWKILPIVSSENLMKHYLVTYILRVIDKKVH